MRSQEFDVSKMINFSCYSFIILPHTSHVFIKIEQCLAYHAFNLKFTMFCTHYGHLVVNCSPYFYRNCPLTHFFPDTDPSVCKHSIVLSHMAICSIISSQFFRYNLVRNYFADTSNPKNILFAKYWTTERVLKLQNQKFFHVFIRLVRYIMLI